MDKRESKLPIYKWTRIVKTTGPTPRPRHGHRAVAIKDLMVVFGGGNEGLHDGLHVFDIASGQWYEPPVNGDTSPGRAAFGFVVDNTRIIAFGGMTEYGKLTNDLYELQATRWEWRHLKPWPSQPIPCPRLGHSFNLLGNRVFMFGGLVQSNRAPDVSTTYLNDLFILNLHQNGTVGWEQAHTIGESPPGRDSHSAVIYQDKSGQSKLIIYGGMNGSRLGDLWTLHIDTMHWTKERVCGKIPLPRSLHSATVMGHRMYVFGGWVPLISHNSSDTIFANEREWKCSNQLACLNLDTMVWEELQIEALEEHLPKARAGHSAVAMNSRIYVWSGRDGYRKAWNNQICIKDMWFLEVEKPTRVQNIQLNFASINYLEISWPKISCVSHYILQIHKFQLVVLDPPSGFPNIIPSFPKHCSSPILGPLYHPYVTSDSPMYPLKSPSCPTTQSLPPFPLLQLPPATVHQPPSQSSPMLPVTVTEGLIPAKPTPTSSAPIVITIPSLNTEQQGHSNLPKVMSPMLPYNSKTSAITNSKSFSQTSSNNRMASNIPVVTRPVWRNLSPRPIPSSTTSTTKLLTPAPQANNTTVTSTSQMMNSSAIQSQPLFKIDETGRTTKIGPAKDVRTHATQVKSSIPPPVKSAVVTHSPLKIAGSTTPRTVKTTAPALQSTLKSTVSLSLSTNTAVGKVNSRPVAFINTSQLTNGLSGGKPVRINIKKMPPPQSKHSCIIIQKPPGPNNEAKENIPKLQIYSQTGQQKPVFKVVNVAEGNTRPVVSLGGAVSKTSTFVLSKPSTNTGTTPISSGNRIITIKNPVTFQVAPHIIKALPKTTKTFKLRQISPSVVSRLSENNTTLAKVNPNEEIPSDDSTSTSQPVLPMKRPHAEQLDGETDEMAQQGKSIKFDESME